MRNRDPFAKWNDPMNRNDPFKPWNDPLHRNDPFAPWNSPLSSSEREYQKYCEENHIPERDR